DPVLYLPLLRCSSVFHSLVLFLIFFSTDTATTEIYTLSLHDALPIFATFVFWLGRNKFVHIPPGGTNFFRETFSRDGVRAIVNLDRKSTRLNSSHVEISYAVFCLKKKNNQLKTTRTTERRRDGQHSGT